MKTGKILVLAALSAFSLGCGATVRESTQDELEKGRKEMEESAATMQLPLNPGANQPAPGGGAAPTTTP